MASYSSKPFSSFCQLGVRAALVLPGCTGSPTCQAASVPELSRGCCQVALRGEMWLRSHAGLERTPVPRHQEWTVLWPGSLPILTFGGDSTHLGSCLLSSPRAHIHLQATGEAPAPFGLAQIQVLPAPASASAAKASWCGLLPHGRSFWSQASGPAANTNCGCRLECGGWQLAELWKLAGPQALQVPQSRALESRVRSGQASKPQAAEPHCHLTEQPGISLLLVSPQNQKPTLKAHRI